MNKTIIAITLLTLLFLSGCSEQLAEEIEYHYPENPDTIKFEIKQDKVLSPHEQMLKQDQRFRQVSSESHTSIEEENRERQEFFRNANSRRAERNRLLMGVEDDEDAEKRREWKSNFRIHTTLGTYKSADEVEDRFGRNSKSEDYSYLSALYRIKYLCYKFENDYGEFDDFCDDFDRFEDEHRDLIDPETYKMLKGRYKLEFKKAGVSDFVEYAEVYGLNDLKNYEELKAFLEEYEIEDRDDYMRFKKDVREYYTELNGYSSFSEEISMVSLY